MLRARRLLLAVLGVGLFGTLSVRWYESASAEPAKPAANARVRKDSGLEERTPWTTSKVHGTPDPADPYVIEPAFPKLQFDEPLAMTAVPGTNRLVVAERKGKIWSFENDPKTATKELLIDVARTVYGVAVHPKFAENGQIFLTTVLDAANPSDKGTRVSRFVSADRKTPNADAKKEEVLIEWPSGGHNGGCLRFGNDGFLYIATGDGSGIADQLQTGQDLSDLLGSMLRIDVDHHDQGRRYAIPKDNPFVSVEKAKPEIYSYGHRQVWKFSFDRQGRLWAGEVGQDLWEMIYLIQKGGNYGWSVQEGLHPFRPERAKGPTPILKPVLEHPHSDFRSITGGWVSESSRLPELKGAYIYGDYDTGRIWSLRVDGEKVTESRELADTTLRIVEFGQDAAGEVYAVDFMSGRIYRLAKAPPVVDAPTFPTKLSETGLFADTKNHVVAAGLIPYSVNAPLYSDNALKDRYIALPGESKIEYDVVVYPQPAPGSTPGWRFPDGSVIVKTFSLEMEAGNPQSARRLETRILQQKLMPGSDEVGEQYWRGYTYVWNDEQTDAVLLEAKGADREFTIKDSAAAGGERKQVWHYPSRAECTLCHTMSAKYVLGLNTLQMNKDHDYDGVIANQLKTLEKIGALDRKLPESPEKLPKLADYTDPHADLNQRARSYLHANCSHCHRKWGGGNAEFQLLAPLPLVETGTLDTRPGHGFFELKEPKLIVAGDPERSLIAHRMQKIGLGRMPHVASTVVDAAGVKLIREWIQSLKTEGATSKSGL